MASARILALTLFLMLFGSVPGRAAAGAGKAPDREHRVKAVFLFNFAQFVQWPDSAFAQPDSPLVVGILGDDPFDAYVDEVVRGEKVNQRPIVVKRFKRVEDAKVCHVLFVSDSEMPRVESVLSSLKSRPVLTVGESDALYRNGGMVCFVTEAGRIRLKINLEAVQNASLAISSKLLRLADVANPSKD
ncbi:MAG: YfiR family protein [Fibrobacteria bacterium]